MIIMSTKNLCPGKFLLVCFLLQTKGILTEFQHVVFSERKDCAGLSLIPVGADGNTKTDSLIECLDQCLSNSTCQSVSFLNAQKTCSKSDVILPNLCAGPTVSVSGSQIYEKTCQNGGVKEADGSCRCYSGYVGTNCERLAYDCSEMGHYTYYTGLESVFKIKPLSSPDVIHIFCSFNYVYPRNYIQRHWGVGTTQFTSSWASYKKGFGVYPVLSEDFWVGNEALHHITTSGNYQLVIEMAGENWSPLYQRAYKRFRVFGESTYYTMIFDYSTAQSGHADPGDSLVSVNGSRFTTADNDVDLISTYNCGELRQAGFWFTDAGQKCGNCNPNGKIMKYQSGEWYEPNEVFWINILNAWSPWYVQMWLEKM